jgi:hypothetical protein
MLMVSPNETNNETFDNISGQDQNGDLKVRRVLGLNWRLLKDPVFMLFLASYFFSLPCAFWSPFYLPSLMVQMGYTLAQGAMLVSISQISAFIG